MVMFFLVVDFLCRCHCRGTTDANNDSIPLLSSSRESEYRASARIVRASERN